MEKKIGSGRNSLDACEITPSGKNQVGQAKYLVFSLAGEEYGVSIRKVKEIIGMIPITQLPRMPAYIKGVINLRGKVLPVLDLRNRFGFEVEECTNRTCIVVMEVEGGSRQLMMGVVVDSVSEVMNIKREEVESPPSFGAKLDTQYIQGLAKTEGGVKILLDIDGVLLGGAEPVCHETDTDNFVFQH